MKRVLFFLLVFSSCISAQQESAVWGKADADYGKTTAVESRDYSLHNTELPGIITEAAVMSYWFLISDQDGDNCPFRPSCSSFLIEAVEKTNILSGTLMFFDRFTRDLNFIGRENNYQKNSRGYYSDPPENYIFH